MAKTAIQDKDKGPGCPGCGAWCGRQGCPVDEGKVHCGKCQKG